MTKEYFAKIIAKDQKGLHLISACCEGAKVKIKNIKYLKSNRIFLMSMKRIINEDKNKKIISSICRFDFIDSVKSKNIAQNNDDKALELLSINIFKKKENYNIALLFKDNAIINLSTEIIELTLEDQKNKND
tara:strand:- start:79 stop:474 length:396 start_codon:yes stop_codon:yes gene_type:complete